MHDPIGRTATQRPHRASLVAAFVLALAAGGCGDEGGIVEAQAAGIEVREGDQPLLRASTLIISDGTTKRFTIRNTGEGELLIKGITVLSDAPAAYALGPSPVPSAASPVVLAPGAAPWQFTLDFAARTVPAGTHARATIRIDTNTTLPEGLDHFTFAVTPETRVARLVLQPPALDFAKVEAATTSTKPLNVLNTGAATLTITRVQLAGDPGFTAVVDGTTLHSGGAGPVTLASPLTLMPSSARHVDVTFLAPSPGPARAELTFFSDDPASPEGASASLYANLVGPCIRAIPQRLDFGAKTVGQTSTAELQLESCGDLDVEISAIALSDSAGGVYAIDLAGLALPLRLAPGLRARVPVSYFPEAFAALGSDGQYLRDRGNLRVTSNAYLATLDVELSGFGSGCCCPVAVIDIAPGREVAPQTELLLSSGSSSASGEITRWQWSVIQPSGSVSQFFPSAEVAAPSFKPNVVGTYIFRLDVYDASDNKSCAPAELVVEVRTDDALHVELLWRTPGDINETDEGSNNTFSAGSDVDLHFLHPLAQGRYFDFDYDCYWLTPVLDWGPAGEVGDPRLDRDDRDGGGPENLNMKVPEDGLRYLVGVHYYNDWGYGNAFATVRVYVYGTLRDQWSDVGITNASLWESHQIEWPSGKVTRVVDADGRPRVTAGYPLP